MISTIIGATWILLILTASGAARSSNYDATELDSLRRRAETMFYHAYDNYLAHGFPHDELRPLTCDGVNTWGNFRLTLIDALDTLAVMGNETEFRRVAEMIVEDLSDFDIDVNTSVFEANIRVVGGLVSAHLLSKRMGLTVEAGWPCDGPLLRLATDLGHRLLRAFDTTTGMPYGTVNLRHGVPNGETSITCTACVGTFILEFGALSRLTGDASFETAALRALDSLWAARSTIGLVGNHIDVEKNSWHALDSGIGAGVDSYFEYLVKGSLMFEMPELMKMFREYAASVAKYLRHGDWHFWAHMHKGGVTQPVFQSLEAFWPGMLSLIGETESAAAITAKYFEIWKKFGFTPEFYDVPRRKPMSKREGYPLRPELIESAMYLYQSTRDPLFLDIGKAAMTSIEESARVACGFASVKDVNSHALDNRLESFFLAETTKYLYLLFSPDHWIFTGWHPENIEILRSPRRSSNDSTASNSSKASDCLLGSAGFIFNTEAHPFDAAAVHCCSREKEEEDEAIDRMLERIDLLSLVEEEEETDEVLEEVFDDLLAEEEEEQEMDSMEAEVDLALDPELIVDQTLKKAEDNSLENANYFTGNSAPTPAQDFSVKPNINKAPAADHAPPPGDFTENQTPAELPASKVDNEILVIDAAENDSVEVESAQNDSSSQDSSSPDADAAADSAASLEVTAKIEEILEKKRQSLEDRVDPEASSETVAGWRRLVSNVLEKIKLDATASVKRLFGAPPKKLNPRLRSNVGDWESMTCPRKPWPLDLGIYPYH